MSTANITSRRIEQVYARWAPIYDLIFGAIFEPGRRAVVAASERLGGRILEVGVGTGISLPYYSDRCRVVGIDLSEQMLRKARRRVIEGRLQNVEQLAVMNAERLDFASDSFDAVVAQCVINTVPNPEAALDEFARVLKPAGEIVLFNRVGAEAGARRVFEQLFEPIAKRLGWHSDFPWERFGRWAANSPHHVHLVERRTMPPLGHFSLIRFRKAAAATGAERESRASGKTQSHTKNNEQLPRNT
jgi:phosphatidylethanolamine/phosphatidyl-N-methylethanolamine N-methyltransferase